MLVAGMPIQTVTDLAKLAEIVKEMKAGKIADALIDLGRQAEELKDLKRELDILEGKMRKESEALTKREEAIAPLEKKLAEEKASLRTQLEVVQESNKKAALREKEVEARLIEAEKYVDRIMDDVRGKLAQADRKIAEAESMRESSREKEAEWEVRIKRLQEAAMGV